MNIRAAIVFSSIIIGAVSHCFGAVSPTSQGRIKFDVDIYDDAGIDTVSSIITLNNIKASEIEPFIRARLSRYGAVQVNDALNMIIVTDKEPKVKDLSELVRKLDVSGLKEFLRLETETIPLKHTDPTDVIPLVQSQLSAEGKISADILHNAIIITDVKSKIEFAKNIINRLDTKIPQALIEAKIIEVSGDYISKLGLDWDAVLSAVGGYGYISGDLYFGKEVREQQQSGSSNYSYKYTTEYPQTFVRAYYNVGVNFRTFFEFVNFLVNENHAKVISSPRIVVKNSKSGRVYAGDAVPYTEQGDTYERRAGAGITLNITPKIRSEGLINLDVYASIGDITGWSAKGAPIINEKTTQSNIDVKDTQTFVMGGLERTTYVDSVKGVPLLKDIPIIKYLFSKKTKTKISRHVLVFITTTILKDGEEIFKRDIEKLQKTGD